MKGANKDAISSSVEYIESRLTEKLDMNELAGQFFFSKTHFQRLFQAIVGEPVMGYVKKRRIQEACQTLCQSKASILEIALQYGYSSHEGFTRAFKALYGMPPAQFRKRHAPGLSRDPISKEVFDMLSNEVTKGIAQHTQTIAKALALFKGDLEKLCASGKKTAIEAGPNGKGVMLLLQELNHMVAKTEGMIEAVKDFNGEDLSVFEVSDKIYIFMTHLDEFAFQMNLLRFLSGIEIARTGSDTFAAFQNDLTNLSNDLFKNYTAAVQILKGLLALLLADIRKESVDTMKSAVELVRQTAHMGSELTERMRTIAAEAGPHGAGFMQIAAELEKQTGRVTGVATIIDGYASELEKAESVPDRTGVDGAVSSLKNIAFTMNLTGFNATIEAARAGDRKAPIDCSNKIKEYAYKLHQTYATCTELLGECNKLSDLLANGGEVSQECGKERPKAMPQGFQKVMDDIIFQGGILSMQLGMEASRWNKDIMLNHAKDAEDALALLSKTRHGDLTQDRNALSEYVNTLSALTKSLHADAEANIPQGLTFDYIAREVDVFIEKMGVVLENMNP